MPEKVFLGNGAELDPCIYEIDAIYKNCTVEILKCPKCGKVSIGWYRQENTEEISEEELYGED